MRHTTFLKYNMQQSSSESLQINNVTEINMSYSWDWCKENGSEWKTGLVLFWVQKSRENNLFLFVYLFLSKKVPPNSSEKYIWDKIHPIASITQWPNIFRCLRVIWCTEKSPSLPFVLFPLITNTTTRFPRTSLRKSRRCSQPTCCHWLALYAQTRLLHLWPLYNNPLWTVLCQQSPSSRPS